MTAEVGGGGQGEGAVREEEREAGGSPASHHLSAPAAFLAIPSGHQGAEGSRSPGAPVV